jgi:Protein of unknown function (DUF3800)
VQVPKRRVARSRDVKFPVHHMLLSVRGLNWEEVYVVPFTVYIDDSGTSPSQHVACATALIIPARQIIRMESEWLTLKTKEGFSDFHTSIFVARNYKSEFAKWDDAKQERVFNRVRQITKKYTVQVFSMAVNKIDYEEIVPAELRAYAGKYHYTWAMRSVLTLAKHWRKHGRISEPYEFVFDWMERKDPARKEIETAMEQAEEEAVLHSGVHGDFKNYGFRDRKTLAGLQCSDLVAWANYQMGLKAFRKTPLHPFAKVALDDFAHMPSNSIPPIHSVVEWNFAIAYERHHLEDWVKREAADGRSLKRFREFEEKKKALKGKGEHVARTR